MNSLTDQQLLRDYTERRSETAFSELVRRHIDFVYSAALRMVRDTHLAEDVTQAVFLALAENTRQLTEHPVLSGWLHRTAQNLAANAVRSDVRRRAREQEAATMNELFSTEPDATWEHIAPHLDSAIGDLSDTDRDAVLLRYFQRKSAHEIAKILGLSDEAAQKRVSRAVERLREYFSKSGIAIGSGGLVALLSINAVQSAPMALSGTISAAAAVGVAVKTTGTMAAGKTLIMTTTQKALIATALAAALATGVYELAQNSRLQNDLQRVEQKLKPLAEQNEQLRRERDGMQKQLLSAQQDAEQGKRQISELPKLRGDVARLRASERELAELRGADAETTAQREMKSWLIRVDQLKKRLEENPDQKIPELQFVTEQDWLDAARRKFKTDKDIRGALSQLRRSGESAFANMLDSALRKYLEANNGKFPNEVSALQNYFKPPIDAALLQRYEVVPPKISPDGKIKQGNQGKVTQSFPIDDEFDTRFTINADGVSSAYPAWRKRTGEDSNWDIISPATKAYKAAYGISMPTDLSLLRPFVTTPEQKAALEKVIQATKEESDKK